MSAEKCFKGKKEKKEDDSVYTNQVEYSVGMSSKFGHLSERRIFPHQDLVLGIPMCADLQYKKIEQQKRHAYKTVW